MDVTNVECKSAAFPNLSKRDDLTAETVPFQPVIPGVIVLFIFAQVFREYYGMKVEQDHQQRWFAIERRVDFIVLNTGVLLYAVQTALLRQHTVHVCVSFKSSPTVY